MLAREKWQIETISVLDEVFEERKRQVARYGFNTDLEDGVGAYETPWLPLTDRPAAEVEAEFRRDYEDFESSTGFPTWAHLVREEVAEAFTEDDPEKLQAELLQVAALCVSWVEVIRAR